MNQIVKKKWVEALRSGEYQQGAERLRTSEGFCCLGVLCDLAIKNGVDASWGMTCEQYSLNIEEESGRWSTNEINLLPQKVMKWAEVESSNPRIFTKMEAPVSVSGKELETLSSLNDYGYSFKEIADLIDARL